LNLDIYIYKHRQKNYDFFKHKVGTNNSNAKINSRSGKKRFWLHWLSNVPSPHNIGTPASKMQNQTHQDETKDMNTKWDLPRL
jgi:hypothetical protein